MNNAKRLIIVLLGSLVANQVVAWSGLTYSVKVIDVPGSTTTSAKSINDRGQVVGTYYDGSRHLSFIYRGGKFTTLDFPNSIETTAHSINDKGQVTGEYWNGGSDVKSFVYSNGAFVTLNVPGYNVAYGINDRGQVTGYYEDAGTHEFIYSDDTFITFDIPGYSLTSDINNRGQVVGRYSVGSHYYGFVYNDKDGVFKTLDVPGSTYTSAYSINAKGVVAGTYISYTDGNYIGHGFVYSRGKYTTLDVMPGQCCTSALSINDSGQVSGTYNDGGDHGFVYSRGKYTTFDFPGSNGGQLVASSINEKGQVVGRYYAGSRYYGFVASPFPTSMKDCEKEGRKPYDFKNQKQCIQYVNTRDDHDHGDHGHE